MFSYPHFIKIFAVALLLTFQALPHSQAQGVEIAMAVHKEIHKEFQWALIQFLEDLEVFESELALESTWKSIPLNPWNIASDKPVKKLTTEDKISLVLEQFAGILTVSIEEMRKTLNHADQLHRANGNFVQEVQSSLPSEATLQILERYIALTGIFQEQTSKSYSSLESSLEAFVEMLSAETIEFTELELLENLTAFTESSRASGQRLLLVSRKLAASLKSLEGSLQTPTFLPANSQRSNL